MEALGDDPCASCRSIGDALGSNARAKTGTDSAHHEQQGGGSNDAAGVCHFGFAAQGHFVIFSLPDPARESVVIM
jgi:hypothetical protein